MLRAILNKSWRQNPTQHQLYGHLPPITKTIQVRWTRHAGYCWRSRDKLKSGVLLWTPSYGRPKAGRPARTYIQQLCEDTGYSSEDLPEVMNDREEWRERVRDIHASGTIWWWRWYGINKCFHLTAVICLYSVRRFQVSNDIIWYLRLWETWLNFHRQDLLNIHGNYFSLIIFSSLNAHKY